MEQPGVRATFATSALIIFKRFSGSPLHRLDRVHLNVCGSCGRALRNGLYRLRVQPDSRGNLQRVRSYRMVRPVPLDNDNAADRQFER